MKRILFSLVTIGAIGITAVAFSGAFFSDTETSTGNVLSAGTLDLQIDNTSYYNNAISSATTWALTDLTIEKFFDFHDVKPGDVGEDTISVHVNDNDSWLCADVTLTSDEENEITPVESIAGDNTSGAGEGELADRINFLWWADDGDNVLEEGEDVLPGGPLGALDVGETANVTLADSSGSIWGSGPLPGNTTKYIGKAWCFGTLAPAPLAQDGVNNLVTPANSTGGVTCDGSGEGNQTQTDSLTADITFSAVQSRNNPGFICGGPQLTPTPTTTLTPTPTPNPGEPFVDEVVSTSGTFGAPTTLSSDPNVAEPLVTGAPNASFIQISDNTTMVFKFVDNKAVNGIGADIRLYIYDALFPATADVAVSDDCSTFVPVGSFVDTANGDIEIGGTGLIEVVCVRLTDQVAGGDPYPTLGFDLDAIEALNSVAVP